MRDFRFLLVLGVVFFIQACVPKTQFDDQQQRLLDAQTKLRSLQASTAECDKDLFLQLKEQAQSLDLLTQELVERNTELSKDVARLKVVESQAKSEDQSCGRKIANQEEENLAKFERTRATYEDLLREQKGEISRLKEQLEKKSEVAPKPKVRTSAPKKEALAAPKPVESPKPKK